MAAPKKKTTKAAAPSKNKSVMFRLSPKAVAKIAKLAHGTKSATISDLIERSL